MNHYWDKLRRTDEQMDALMAHTILDESKHGLEKLLPCYLRDGYSVRRAIEVMVEGNLKNDMARGNGNAANRRLRRLQDQHEAEQATFDWYDSRRLSEADVDNLALEWEYRHTHEV